MSRTTYIHLIVILLLSFGCTPNSTAESERDNKVETTATVDTELITETLDTTIVPAQEVKIEENVQLESKPETKKNTTEDTDTPTEEYPSGSMFINNSYLILQSTTSYSAAMNTAKKASDQLGHKLDFRGYVFDFKAGLKDTTVCGCGEIHEYVPRGRYDDGNYVSIEHTNSFTEFTDGYYIVVAASGKRKKLQPVLAKAKAFYGDAYIKDAKVYIGCMH